MLFQPLPPFLGAYSPLAATGGVCPGRNLDKKFAAAEACFARGANPKYVPISRCSVLFWETFASGGDLRLNPRNDERSPCFNFEERFKLFNILSLMFKPGSDTLL
ncbi:hypothetical protein M758_12G000200 [Ceratodon purpureus]|nr:hypothetical protein M758_12G000200 [Ceratodon purpureus]